MKDLSLHILDIVQNSISAGAQNIGIVINEDKLKNEFGITISDDGSGMGEDELTKATDPYFTSRTTRKVGLGVPLFKQNAERTGGRFAITSEKGKGTTVNAVFGYDNLDRPILGDITGVVVILVTANPELDFAYQHTTEKGTYIFDTKKIKLILEDTPINHPQVGKLLKEMLKENLKDIEAET
jgi:anti-sigma regulatory factor (Ser/Thr protein kinase)